MVKKEKACTGCTACMNICPKAAIQMKEDCEGFLYPNINETLCIGCNLCDKVCPILKEKTSQRKQVIAYAAKNKENNVRKICASGGVFSAISDWILDQNGSVYGAVFDKNFQVIHAKAENKKIRDRMRGSKYPQSSLDHIFQKVKSDLDSDKKVLFSGTPCQIDGLKSYLRKEYKQLYLCDIICHGVMSPKVFQDFIQFLSKKFHASIKSICFRDKKEDWINQRWKYEMENGKVRVDDTYMLKLKKLYYGHLCMRPSCHECLYANLNRVSDLTIGDYWGIDEAVPGFRDHLGISCILVNTEKGVELLENISGKLELIKTPIEKCIQPQLLHPSEKSDKREEFWKSYQNVSFYQILRRYAKLNIKDSIKSRIPIKIRKKLKGV